jgi:outer membrane protein TolC
MRTILLAVALLLAVAAPALAQAPLAFDRAAALALAQNPAIRAARAEADRAAADVTEARAGWFPRLSFTESVRRSDQPGVVFGARLSARRFAAANFAIDALNHPAGVTAYQRTFGIDQVLVDFGRTRAASRAAGHRREIADAAIRQTAASIVVSVANAYGRVLAAEANARAAASAVTAADEDVVRAEHRRDTGTATDADVLSMRAHASGMRQRVIQASADATIARTDLNRLMGGPLDAPFTVVEPILPPADTTGAGALLAEAERSRPELAMAHAAQSLAEARMASARAGWWPQVSAQATAEQDGLSFGERASTWTAGVELRWSWSLGGADAARTRSAAADLARARAEADDVKAGVEADVITALARAGAARARIDAGQAAIAQARESLRIIRDRYDAGLAAVSDVLRASTALLDAETARVSALADALSADAALDRAAGRTPFSLR